MKKIIYIFLSLTAGISFAQDIHFSQLSETPLLVNPANTGNFDGYQRAIINYRNQWSTAGSPYKTMAATVDASIGLRKNKTGHIGVGGFIFQDKAGAADWKQFKTDLYLNGILKVGKESRLALAIGGGYGQTSADFSKLTFGNQYTGTDFSQEVSSQELLVFKNFSYTDLSSGIVFEYDKTSVNFDRNNLFALRIGAAAYHINQPILKYGGATDVKLPRRFVGTLSGRYDFKDTKISIMPNFIYMIQSKFTQINAGLMLRIRFNDQTKITGVKHETALYVGISHRVNDAVIPQIMFETKGFGLGFSYDYNVSNFKSASRGVGGFEISLRWINLRDGLFRQGREFGKSGKPTASPTP